MYTYCISGWAESEPRYFIEDKVRFISSIKVWLVFYLFLKYLSSSFISVALVFKLSGNLYCIEVISVALLSNWKSSGFKCPTCSAYGKVEETVCPKCGAHKYIRIIRKDEVQTTCFTNDGQEKGLVYRRLGDKILIHGQEPDRGLRGGEKKQRMTLVKLSAFSILAT